jgi:hypothetical protein
MYLDLQTLSVVPVFITALLGALLVFSPQSTLASLLPAIFIATNNTAAIFDFHFEQNRGLHHTNGKA